MELYCRANREKPSSIEGKKSIFRNYLVPWLGSKKLDALGDTDVQRIKANMQHLASKTVNNTLTVLSTILESGARKYGFSSFPEVKLLKVAPTKMDFYEADAFERLVIEAGKLDARSRLMVLLGGDAGLRCDEILGVEYKDVDFARGILHVERAVWQGRWASRRADGRAR